MQALPRYYLVYHYYSLTHEISSLAVPAAGLHDSALRGTRRADQRHRRDPYRRTSGLPDAWLDADLPVRHWLPPRGWVGVVHQLRRWRDVERRCPTLLARRLRTAAGRRQRRTTSARPTWRKFGTAISMIDYSIRSKYFRLSLHWKTQVKSSFLREYFWIGWSFFYCAVKSINNVYIIVLFCWGSFVVRGYLEKLGLCIEFTANQ